MKKEPDKRPEPWWCCAPRRLIIERWAKMKLLFALTTLVLLSGCGSNGIEPPEQYSEVRTPSKPLVPDLMALRELFRKVDRLEIYLPRDFEKMTFSKVKVSSREAIVGFQKLFDDPTIVPSEISLSMGFGDPEIVAFCGPDRLFRMMWNYDAKFQILYAHIDAIAGSYEVPPDWHARFVQLCRRIQQEDPNQSSQPTPGS